MQVIPIFPSLWLYIMKIACSIKYWAVHACPMSSILELFIVNLQMIDFNQITTYISLTESMCSLTGSQFVNQSPWSYAQQSVKTSSWNIDHESQQAEREYIGLLWMNCVIENLSKRVRAKQNIHRCLTTMHGGSDRSELTSLINYTDPVHFRVLLSMLGLKVCC